MGIDGSHELLQALENIGGGDGPWEQLGRIGRLLQVKNDADVSRLESRSREVSLLRMARVSRSGREHGQAVPDLESDLVREIDRLRSPCGSVVLHLDQPATSLRVHDQEVD